MRVLALLAATAVVTVGLQAPSSAVIVDRDCSDFPSQQAAQLFFLSNDPAADPHGLDADGDGVVCESNPGPYYYGSNPNPGGTGGGGNTTPAPVKPPKPAPIKVVKAVGGDTVRLRQGSDAPFNVRLLGLKVSTKGCLANGARKYLRTVAKPGRIVTIVTDKKAPKRDKRGYLIAEVRPKNGDAKSGFSRKVITNGWASVQGYNFAAKKTYKNLMASADYWRDGLFGECITDYGSEKWPYRVGTTFEVDGWRYTFGATDFDALPEMQAEAAAAPGTYTFTAPPASVGFRRVQVTATRLTGRSPQYPTYGYVYEDTVKQTGDTTYGSCGTAPNLLDQMTVSPGQTVTAYLCTAKPHLIGGDQAWVIGDADGYILRYVEDSP